MNPLRLLSRGPVREPRFGARLLCRYKQFGALRWAEAVIGAASSGFHFHESSGASTLEGDKIGVTERTRCSADPISSVLKQPTYLPLACDAPAQCVLPLRS